MAHDGGGDRAAPTKKVGHAPRHFACRSDTLPRRGRGYPCRGSVSDARTERLDCHKPSNYVGSRRTHNGGAPTRPHQSTLVIIARAAIA